MVVRSSDDEDDEKSKIKTIGQHSLSKGSNRNKVNRYALKFFLETDDELNKKKEEAKKEVEFVPENYLEISEDDYFDKNIDFPKRPEWSYDLTRDELNIRENRYFAVSY